jgi:hypothetical protein
MANLNIIEAVRFYINQMVKDCDANIRALVMDKETVCEIKYFHIFIYLFVY